MKILLILPAILLIDLIRSAIVVALLQHEFYKVYKPQQDVYSLGKGPAFHIVLLGDSGIDGHGSNSLKFGPAQTLIESLTRTYSVTVHIFAKESSRSYDVIQKQLPKVKALSQVDVVFVYMGANNLIRLRSSNRVVSDFEILINYTTQKNIPLIATEVANYYHLTMFSWVQRLIIYVLIKDCNTKLRQLAKVHRNFVLVDMTWLTKKYISPAYMADRLHPNDPMIRLWADKAYSAAQTNPATKGLLTGIIAKR
jgi:lysophospholipase L1-like esterase